MDQTQQDIYMRELAVRAIIDDIAAADSLLRKTAETGGRQYEEVTLGNGLAWDGDELVVSGGDLRVDSLSAPTLVVADVITDDSDKIGELILLAHDTSGEPEGTTLLYGFTIDMFGIWSGLYIGGGDASRNAVMTVAIYTAADSVTRTGTARVTITGSQIYLMLPVVCSSTVRANSGFNYNGTAGLTGTLTLDDGANWRITLTFSGGILTGHSEAASAGAVASWA